jgi:acyl-coenzyme A thioesterase PaaI-like protein
MTNKLAKLITRLDSIPAGIRPYFVSQILGRSVPFVGTVGVLFDELAMGRARLSLSNRRRVRNHIGTMHGAAITLLAEAASGFALAMSIPDDKTPLIKSLQVRFLKKAEGDLAAVATLSSEAMSRVSSEDRGELIVPVKVTDASGNEPVACEALWAWVPRTSRTVNGGPP